MKFEKHLTTANKSARGPNWIHGTENNPILDLADVTKTTYIEPPIDANPLIFTGDGKLLSGTIARQHTGLVWETIEEANTYSKANSAKIAPEISLFDFFERRVRERQLNQADSNLILSIARVWGDIVGEPIEKQSLKFFWLEECVGGGELLSISPTLRR